MRNKLAFKKEFYYFITGRASIAIARRLHRNLKKASITISTEQWSILYQLWEKEGLSQQEIGKNTFKDKTSITRLLNNLEAMNLVVRIPHQSDKRTKLVYLTQKGKDLQENSMTEADNTLKEALKGVSEEEIQICHEVLEKAFNNLKQRE